MNYPSPFYHGVQPQETERYEKPQKIVKNIKTESEPTNSNQCKICGLINFNTWALTMHMRRHNNERPSKCAYCTASFVNNSELKSHIATKHTKDRRHKCRFCPETFASNSSRYFHEDKHGILQHKCKYCEEKFKTKIQRRVHQKTHGKEELACTYCPKKFSNEEFVKAHEEKDHGRIIKSLKCTKCKLSFTSREEFNAHKEVHKSMSPNTRRTQSKPKSNEVSYFQDSDVKLSSYFFTCGVCSEKFSFHIDLTKHIEANHTEEKDAIYKYKCDVCSKSFDTLVKLRGHKIGHGPKKHKCNNCDYKTARAKDLERHVEAKHSSHKAYQCSECGEAFTQYYNFVNHKLKHGEKKFKCTVCDKAYYVKSRLSKHIRSVHNSERQVCDQCGRVYSNMLSLKVHKNYMHKSPPLCLCNHCGKSILVTEVSLHQPQCTKITTNNAPSHKKLNGPLCLECNITFSVPRYLLEHCKEFHPENIYPCRVCKNEYFSLESAEKHFLRSHVDKQKSPLMKPANVFTIEEKRSLRMERSFAVLEDFYECFGCGSSFAFENQLEIHLSLDSCSTPMPVLDSFKLNHSTQPNCFLITKVHENRTNQKSTTDVFEINVLPKFTFSSPLSTIKVFNITDSSKTANVKPEIKTEDTLKLADPIKINSTKQIPLHSNAKINSKRKLSLRKEFIKTTKVLNLKEVTLRNNPMPIRPRQEPIQQQVEDLSSIPVVTVISEKMETPYEVLSPSENRLLNTNPLHSEYSSEKANGIISSENLMSLLQEKIVNLHGQSFLPLNEVMDRLKQITGVSLDNA